MNREAERKVGRENNGECTNVQPKPGPLYWSGWWPGERKGQPATKSFIAPLNVSIHFISFQAIKKCRDIPFAYLAENAEKRRGSQHLTNYCGAQGSFLKDTKSEVHPMKRTAARSTERIVWSATIPITTSAPMGLPRVALERPCYFY